MESENEFFDDLLPNNGINMYVLSNGRNSMGANALLNNSLLHDFAMKNDSNLIIFPSSINELIIIFEKDFEQGIMDVEAVKHINESAVMLADVDFFIEFPDGSIGILECKTTNYNCQDKWVNDTVPINYEYQGRHYMSVMNINKMYFACLYGNNENEFIIRYMERDLDLEEDLIAEEEFFWKENVKNQVEPPYVEKPDLVLESIRKHCGPADVDAEQIKLPKKHLLSVQNYLSLKEEKSRLDSEVKKLEERMKESYAEIVEELGVSCSGIISDGTKDYIISYNPFYRTGIDKKGLERLKINHPDIYEEYVSVSESRRFGVKTRGAA